MRLTRPDSDVDRALQPTGGSTLRHRSFASDPAVAPPPDDIADLPPPALTLGAFETAFVLELPAAAQAAAPPLVVPLADLFRMLGQRRHPAALR